MKYLVVVHQEEDGDLFFDLFEREDEAVWWGYDMCARNGNIFLIEEIKGKHNLFLLLRTVKERLRKIVESLWW